MSTLTLITRTLREGDTVTTTGDAVALDGRTPPVLPAGSRAVVQTLPITPDGPATLYTPGGRLWSIDSTRNIRHRTLDEIMSGVAAGVAKVSESMTAARDALLKAAPAIALLAAAHVTDVCPGCDNEYPADELCRDRNGDNVCSDCLLTWSAYPDHR